MLPARPLSAALPIFEKRAAGKDVSLKNAFARTDTIELSVRVPRALGACAVVLRLFADEGGRIDLPFRFLHTQMSNLHGVMAR